MDYIHALPPEVYLLKLLSTLKLQLLALFVLLANMRDQGGNAYNVQVINRLTNYFPQEFIPVSATILHM
jgi:hypothetical protein